MSINIFELRKGIYARLTSAIAATKTYSYIPPETAMPYIYIGEITAGDSSTNLDAIYDYDVMIHGFDKNEGNTATIDALVKSIHDALHSQEANITVTGYTVVRCHNTYLQVLQQGEINDNYWHAVLRFNIMIQDT